MKFLNGVGAVAIKPLSLLLLIATLLLSTTPAHADGVPAPPNPSSIDERNVDLLSGKVVADAVDVSIGPSDEHGLRVARQYVGNGWRLSDVPTISGSTANPIVSFGGQSIPFKTVSGIYVPEFPDGSTLSSDRTTFTSSDGTVIQFGLSGYMYPMFNLMGGGDLGTKITYPDATVWNFNYNTGSFLGIVPGCYIDQWGDPCYTTYSYARLSSITSSTGYQIKLTYASDTLSASTAEAWNDIVKATAINNSIEYCDPLATCSLTNTWPQATYSPWDSAYNGNPLTSVSDREGRTTSYTYTMSGGYELSGVKPAGASSNTTTYAYNSSGQVSSVTSGGHAWLYTYPAGQTTVTDPLNQTTTISYGSDGLITSLLKNNQYTYYYYCPPSTSGCPEGLLQTVQTPENNYLTYTYNDRGDVTSEMRTPTSGLGTLPYSLVTSAAYPANCTSPYTLKNCNKPTSTTDEHGNVTNYTFDPNSGALTVVTGPADPSGVHPQTRTTYGAVHAWYKNSSGTLVQGPAVTMPTSISQCRTTASCAGTADEKLTTIAYPASGPSNAQPSSVTVKAGNNTLVETTALTYNNFGQVLTIDGPLAGTGDTTRIRYDQYGQPQGQVAPAPGVGGLTNMATRYLYDAWGHVNVVEMGTVADQSDAAWSNFAESSRTTTSYDSYGRPTRQKASGPNGTTDYEVTDTVYDPNGRVWCTIARMDPAQWATVASTCSPPQTTGPNGPDRVTQYTYDALDRVTKVSTGVGITGLAADDVTTTYTPNGQVKTQKDANGNTTTYSYDGYDRLTQIAYPLGKTEKYAYPTVATDNWVKFTTRANHTLTFDMDNLGRVTEKTYSTGAAPVIYGYDLFGDMTSARFTSASGDGVGYTYDALGRQLTETQAMDGTSRAITSVYNADDSRHSMTYPNDGNYIVYNRDNLGRLYYSALNGSHELFYPARDSHGRTTTLYRLDPATSSWSMSTSFGYDPVSRLSSLTQGLAGTSYDATTSFTYNPASQIASRTQTNDAYAWTGAANVSRSYTPNALNQLPGDGSATYGYDADGNLASATHVFDAGTGLYDDYTYTYDAENRLVTAVLLKREPAPTPNKTITTSLRYDPLGRLYEVNDSEDGITRFLYDGDDLVAEYNSAGTLLRRYVHGDGADEPEVWFEGSGVTDTARRYLYADERGSIVAVSDSAGNKTAIDSYDEYGIPDDGSAASLATKGRFRYTGQAWLPELGMYYYKARMYSPTLGRFMQTDPIGYGDGMNMYRYAHDDPINHIDPSGMNSCEELGRTVIASGWGWTSFGSTGSLQEIGVVAPLCGPYLWELFGPGSYGDYTAPQYGTPTTAGGETTSGCDFANNYCQQPIPCQDPLVCGPKPQDTPCLPSRGNLGSTIADRVGDVHGSIFAAGAAAERNAGNIHGATAIGRAALPGAVLLGGVSEGIAAANDHANGMTVERSAAIHGGGFIGGLAGGFMVGEAVDFLGGGIPGAIIGGIVGSVGGTAIGETAGAGIATANGFCR